MKGRGLDIEPRGGRTVQRPTKVQTMRKTSNRQGCTGAKGSHHVHKGNDIKLITFFIMKTNYRSSSIAPYCWQRMLLVWSNFIVMDYLGDLDVVPEVYRYLTTVKTKNADSLSPK